MNKEESNSTANSPNKSELAKTDTTSINSPNNNNTNPILSDAMRIGGTESFKTNLVKGNALPCATAIKSKINKCFKGKS